MTCIIGLETEDGVRWGDTWLNRSPQGQEARLSGDVRDYYDKFFLR